MTSNKLSSITNQQFLKELEKRLPDFTQDEFVTLIRLLNKYQEEVMKIIQLANPKIYN
jgi:hypothetical protein